MAAKQHHCRIIAHQHHSLVKDGECGGGLVAREDAGSDSDSSPGVTPPKSAFTALTLRPAAAATARVANGDSGDGPERTPSKARQPVMQVLPPEPRRSFSARAHHPCAPWFRPDKGAIEPRPSRRSLSVALTEEPLLLDRGDAMPNDAAVHVHVPQVPSRKQFAAARVGPGAKQPHSCATGGSLRRPADNNHDLSAS